MVKNPPTNPEDARYADLILGWEDPLEEGIATHYSTHAWKIPWREKLDPFRSPQGCKDLDVTVGN